MKQIITLQDIKTVVKSQLFMLKLDFKNKEVGEKARLLHKHYKGILVLLNAVKKETVQNNKNNKKKGR